MLDLPNEERRMVYADHRAMCKFASRGDQTYLCILTGLRRWFVDEPLVRASERQMTAYELENARLAEMVSTIHEELRIASPSRTLASSSASTLSAWPAATRTGTTAAKMRLQLEEASRGVRELIRGKEEMAARLESGIRGHRDTVDRLKDEIGRLEAEKAELVRLLEAETVSREAREPRGVAPPRGDENGLAARIESLEIQLRSAVREEGVAARAIQRIVEAREESEAILKRMRETEKCTAEELAETRTHLQHRVQPTASNAPRMAVSPGFNATRGQLVSQVFLYLVRLLLLAVPATALPMITRRHVICLLATTEKGTMGFELC